MLAGLRSQRPMRPRPDSIGKNCRAVCNGLPMQPWLPRTVSPYGQGGPSSDRHTKVVLGPCHYRAIHSGHDRSRADNHGQRHGALDLRRSPNFAGDDLPQSGFACRRSGRSVGGEPNPNGPHWVRMTPATSGFPAGTSRLNPQVSARSWRWPAQAEESDYGFESYLLCLRDQQFRRA